MPMDISYSGNDYSRSKVSHIDTKAGGTIDAVYEDENTTPTVDMFLQLMISQMQNQDPMNPVDNTQYVTQMSQIAAMQQMQELAYYSRSNFVMSMIGKEVTVAQNKIGGGYTQVTGPVERVSIVEGEYRVVVGGKQYSLQQIMEIGGDAGKQDGVINDYKLSLENTTDTTAVISWSVPKKEDDANADKYKYTIYYSKSGDMDKLEDIKKGNKGSVVDKSDVSQATLTGLDPDTIYYVNVVRTSPDGKEEVYKKLSFTTAKKK